MTLFLAYRNLTRRLRRYMFMALAVSVAFALITIVTGAAYGALEAIKDKAARYFSGHLSITGFLPGLKHGIADPGGVIETLSGAKLPVRTIAPRTVYYTGDARIFFGGETIRQRKLIGIDFSAEGVEFDGLRFTQGHWRGMLEGGEPGILLSAVAAKILGCRPGDGISLSLSTDTGQYNTAELIVQGIFDETSLFGYAAYIGIEDLNRLLLRPEGAATDVAVYLKSGADSRRHAATALRALESRYRTAPLFASREERDARLGAMLTEPTLVILTQDAQLSQIRQLLDALLAITYFVLLIFLTIVMAGILNTYRVLVHERRREIGMLRALGMGRKHVRVLFISEAALLALSSSAVGLLLGLAALRILSYLDFSFLPGSGLFLESGRLRFELNGTVVLGNGAMMAAAAVIAAWGPAKKAGRIRPAEAMRSA